MPDTALPTHLRRAYAEQRPARRPSSHANANLSPAQEREHLVRVIASSPIYLDWLRDHNAKLLAAEAARAAEAGRTAAAEHLRARAEAHRTAEVAPW